MAQSSSRKNRSWKDIEQDVMPKTLNPEVARRLVGERVKVAIALVAIVASVFVFLSVINTSDNAPEMLAKTGESLPIERMEIQSDGVLRPRWVFEFLQMGSMPNDLLSVDVEGIKKTLESLEQVRQAEAQRQFPDTLIITIQERSPVARIVASKANGDRVTLLVDEEGVVFEGVNYGEQFVRRLPALAGVTLKKREFGFERIGGMRGIAGLLREAKAVAPHIYKSWKVVSLERLPLVSVKSTRVEEILIRIGDDYAAQIAKLDYILDSQRGDMLNKIKRVDLTLGSQVAVGRR